MADDLGDNVQELHRDLANKYRIHGSKVESLWSDFTKDQRTKAVKAGAAEGVVLKHRNDASLGDVHKFLPEWNLRELTDPASTHFIDLLRHRATTSLMEQYRGDGLSDRARGDHLYISEMVRTGKIRHVDERRLRNCWSFFLSDDERYGQSIQIMNPSISIRDNFGNAVDAGLCVSQTVGDLILKRQQCLLQSLNIIIEDILDIGSTTRTKQDKPAPQTANAATAAMSKLSLHVQGQSTKLSLPNLMEVARDHKASLNEYLVLLFTEPVLLAHDVNLTFFSRPELVADEKGRMLPVITDRYIGVAFFEVVSQAVKAAATWNYVCRLTDLLQDASDKTGRAIVLQEISNVLQLEYTRARSLLKRHVQTGVGAKHFRRVSNVHDNGNARVNMKTSPDTLTRVDPQLHYLLRLCQTDTHAAQALGWMDKLGQLHDTHQQERERLSEREFDAVCNHAVVIAIVQDFSSSISMPTISRKKGQLFLSRLNELEAELTQFRDQLDLMDYVVPIDNLLEPGMAQKALEALGQAVVSKLGTKLEFLYEELIEDCLQGLIEHYRTIKEKPEQNDLVSFPHQASQTLEARIERRKQKEKTRPAHSSIFEIPIAAADGSVTEEGTIRPPTVFKVKSSTMSVFSALFTKSEARGAVSWDAFTSAMADLGFSVIPKSGSIYTFEPPEDLNVKKSVVLHRPHKSVIEPWLSIVFAKRLGRVYGWDISSFESA